MIGCDTTAVRVISCDVFDTLLQRNGIAEPTRVGLIARRAAAMLAQERGIHVDAGDLRRARINVQRFAYRALDMLDPTGEVAFARLTEGMATSLGLGPAEADILARAEIAVERTQLASNVRLLAWLKRQAAHGIRIIAISDTWHSGQTIQELLDTVAPNHPISKVYTSADIGVTKRSGQIFARVAADEALASHAFLHIGDDELADDTMAHRAGWRAHRIRRPRMVMLSRRLDGASVRLRRMPAC